MQELSANGTYGTFGTICHEFSHCFGFPDFYYGSSSPLYKWELMDYGNYNGSGFCPPCYSAHERWLMGWLTPTELTEATSVTNMAAMVDEPQAYLVRNDGYPDEYYIVENRQQRGWDASLPGSGLLIFHIDYDSDIWTSTTQATNTSSVKRYTVFNANNRSSSTTCADWAYPYMTNDELTDTSSPAATLLHANADGRKLMSKPLTAMSVADGLASFDFMGGTTAVRTLSARQPSQILYDLGPIYIIRCADGKVRKIEKLKN